MRAVTIALALSVGLLALALPAAAQDKAKGAELFTSQKCQMCHSVADKGNKKGALDGVGAKLSADDIRMWVTDPDAMRAKTKSTKTPPMKKMTLTKPQVDDLVAYLASLK